MEDASILFKNSKIAMSRQLDSSTTTQMAQIMVHYGRPSRFSWPKSVRSSFGRTLLVKAIWENPFKTWLGENSKLGMSLCSSWKRIILICVCGWHELAGKKQNIDPMWKVLNKEADLGEATSFPWSCILGMHSTSMRSKSKYCGQLQNHVWIANFCGGNRETSILPKYS